jgi:hypothetical protein
MREICPPGLPAQPWLCYTPGFGRPRRPARQRQPVPDPSKDGVYCEAIVLILGVSF